MKIKIIITNLFILLTLSLSAQSFKLVGVRGINAAEGWDKSVANSVHFDQAGRLYLHFTTFDTIAYKVNLIRHDFTNNQWSRVLAQDIVFAQKVEESDAIGLNDGTSIAVTQQYNSSIGKYFNSMYRISPDGTHNFLGPNPITATLYDFYQGYPAMALAPNGNIYLFEYASSISLSSVHRFTKWNGIQWADLPGLPLADMPRNVSIAINSQGRVYASYYIRGQNKTKVVRLNANETSWEELFITEQADRHEQNPKVHVTFDDEVYLTSYTLAGDFTTGFFGLSHIFKQTANGWVELGNGMRVGPGQSFLKTQSGELYLTGSDVVTIYKYNPSTNTWVPLQNDIQDGQRVSGYRPQLIEGSDGKIYNIFSNGIYLEMTVVQYKPETLSVNDIGTDESDISIYPNPFKNSFNIKLGKALNDGKHTYELLDASGRLIKKDKLSENISANHLEQGVYIFTIKDRNGKMVATKKIIKN